MSSAKTLFRNTRVPLGRILLVLAAGPIMAQDKPKTDDPPQETTSREVVVTATRTERDVFDVPASISVIDSKEIERRPKGTIAQILQDVPGIQVTDGGVGGGNKRVVIRGEEPSGTLVLIDGMKISEQKSMDGSMIMIDPNNVERIEVLKGSASVLYGSDAIGGIVNIITKKGGASPLQGTQAFTWDGSNGALIPYTSIFGGHNGFSYRVSGDYTDAGDKVGGSGKIENSGYLQRNWSAYMDYALSKGKVGVGYDHYWSSSRVPGVTEEEAESITVPGMGGNPMTVNGTSTTSVNVDLPDWRRDRYYAFFELEKLSDTLRKVKLSPYIQNTKKDFVNNVAYNFEGKHQSGITVKNKVNQNIRTFNDQVTYGANLQTDWTFGPNHYVIGGIDYIHDNLDATSKNPSGRVYVWVGALPGTPGFPPGGMTMTEQDIDTSYDYFYKGNQQGIAAYVQDEWSIHSDLTATLGLRWTSHNSELSDTNDNDPKHKIEARSDSGGKLVYSAGVVYSGIQDFRLRALASTGYRYPLLNELYVGTGMGNAGYCYPNPDLKPETSNNFEVGARYDANGLACDLGVFYATAKNHIHIWRVPDRPAGSPEYMFDNVASHKTHGAELALSYRHQPTHLTPYLSGVWINRTFNHGGDEGETDATGMPKWNGNAGVRYEYGSASSLNLHADAYGRFTASCDEEINETTQNTLLHNPGWATLNFAFGVRKPFSADKKRSFFADVNLNNVLNKAYIPAMSTLEDPGFHVVVRAGLNF